MTRRNKQYECQSCAAVAGQWSGRCPSCGAWNSLVAVADFSGGTRKGFAGLAGGGIQTADRIELSETHHLPTGIDELDGVLGGGLVPGSVVLIGGDPGIGKSTLLLQTLVRIQRAGTPALYVTGEESLNQIVLRARRLGLDTTGLSLLAETCVERILAAMQGHDQRFLVIDSVQTLFSEQNPSAPGGVSQVRDSAGQLVQYAKQTSTGLFLVGHVTKEGALAGPRVLEHMVDTVLYFESDANSRYRILRSVKNRFGPVNELGLFAMSDVGLKQVKNPSAMFLSRTEVTVPGSTVMVSREGTRPLLVEVQALVDESVLANPRRVSVGIDTNRLAMLMAVLHRFGGITTQDQDIFINVVGGIRINETAIDLAVLLAVVSSLRNECLSRELVTFGEVGLGGEIRPVPNGEDRLMEAEKHGFKLAVVPKANVPKNWRGNIRVLPVERTEEAIAVCRETA